MQIKYGENGFWSAELKKLISNPESIDGEINCLLKNPLHSLEQWI